MDKAVPEEGPRDVFFGPPARSFETRQESYIFYNIPLLPGFYRDIEKTPREFV
jgi:hypothetical protein